MRAWCGACIAVSANKRSIGGKYHPPGIVINTQTIKFYDIPLMLLQFFILQLVQYTYIIAMICIG